MNIKLFREKDYILDLPNMNGFLNYTLEEIKKWNVGYNVIGFKKHIAGKDKIENVEKIIVTLIHKSKDYLILHLYKPEYNYTPKGIMRTPEYEKEENERMSGQGVYCIDIDTSKSVETMHIVDLKNTNIELGLLPKKNSWYIREITDNISKGKSIEESFEYEYQSYNVDYIFNFRAPYPDIKTPKHNWKKKYKGKELDLNIKYTNNTILDIIQFKKEAYVLLKCHGTFPCFKEGQDCYFSSLEWQKNLNNWKFLEKDIIILIKIIPNKTCDVCNSYMGKRDFKIYNNTLFKFEEINDYGCQLKTTPLENPFWSACNDFSGLIKYGSVI